MTFVVTFAGFTPGKRYTVPPTPWTRVRIDVAPIGTTAWTPVETQNLPSIDVDPTNPATRNITTTLGPISPGLYRLAWLDAATGEEDTDALMYPAQATRADRIITQVQNLLHARTRDTNGVEIRAFVPLADGRTNPTYEEVVGLVSDAESEVYPVFGDTIPDNPSDPAGIGYDVDILRKAADRVVALRVAALIELGYYPQEVSRQNSPYPFFQAEFEAGLKRVGHAIQEAGAGDTVGMQDDSFDPSYSFPDDDFVGGAIW